MPRPCMINRIGRSLNCQPSILLLQTAHSLGCRGHQHKRTNNIFKNVDYEKMLRNDTKGEHYLKGISIVPTVPESALSSRASLPVCASLCSAHRLFLSSKQLDLGDSWHFVARQSSRPIKWRISALHLPDCSHADAELRHCPTLQQTSSSRCIPWLICIQQTGDSVLRRGLPFVEELDTYLVMAQQLKLV